MFNKKVSEKDVCRSVYDRHDVLKAQIVEKCLELLRKNQTSFEDQVLLKREVEALVDQHTNGLVKSISDMF